MRATNIRSSRVNMTFQIFLTLFLVLLNGFFVAAEFAIVKVRSSQIEIKTKRNKSIVSAARQIVNNLDGYLAATQLGITLASLGLGWVGESVMTTIIMRAVHSFGGNLSEVTAHQISIPIAFFFITVLHIVFGELAPKSIAIRYPTNTTFTIALPLRIFYIIFRPFIWLLNGMANLILRIFGITSVHGGDIHSEEELKMIITESHEGGAIEQTERELIQNVFDFDDRSAGDIQTLRKNITAIPSGMDVKQALDFALREGYSRYPVFDGTIDEIVGIINTKDLMKSLMDPHSSNDLKPLIRPAYFVADNRKIKDLLKALQLRRAVLAIVTNEIGEVSGIVTVEDILEELVGEIQDEYDDEKPYVQETGVGTYIIDAHRKLGDINKYLPYRLEEDDDYETLAGYIAFHYPEDHKKGSKLRIQEYDVTILTMYRNSAATVEFKVADEK